MSAFLKDAKWIGQPGVCCESWKSSAQPAPFFRKTFTWSAKSSDAKILLCGLGYYELHLNGKKVGDHVLDPVPSQYDKRVRYVSYDVSKLLKEGKNAIGVVLGNGWYNCHTPEVWHFDKASWRDYPKLLLQLESKGKAILVRLCRQ